MLISPRLDIPSFIKRSLAAYRAGDPVTVAEAFANNAALNVHIDAKLARHIGLVDLNGQPIRSTNAVQIMRYYALEMASYDITHFEVLESMTVGRNIAALCEWGIKVHGSDTVSTGRCHNIWTLDRSGKKIVEGHSVCKLITPFNDFSIN